MSEKSSAASPELLTPHEIQDLVLGLCKSGGDPGELNALARTVEARVAAKFMARAAEKARQEGASLSELLEAYEQITDSAYCQAPADEALMARARARITAAQAEGGQAPQTQARKPGRG